jgi:hypothetical protein
VRGRRGRLRWRHHRRLHYRVPAGSSACQAPRQNQSHSPRRQHLQHRVHKVVAAVVAVAVSARAACCCLGGALHGLVPGRQRRRHQAVTLVELHHVRAPGLPPQTRAIGSAKQVPGRRRSGRELLLSFEWARDGSTQGEQRWRGLAIAMPSLSRPRQWQAACSTSPTAMSLPLSPMLR